MKLQAFAHRAPVSTVAAVLMAALMPLEARADVMSSGFELGVRFVATPRGIRVIRVRPESAADGELFGGQQGAVAAPKGGGGAEDFFNDR